MSLVKKVAALKLGDLVLIEYRDHFGALDEDTVDVVVCGVGFFKGIQGLYLQLAMDDDLGFPYLYIIVRDILSVRRLKIFG